MSTALVAVQTAIQTQASSDDQMIALWLHGKSPHSQAAYRADVGRFLVFLGKPLQAITLGELQTFCDSLQGAQNSKRRVISSIKSRMALRYAL